MGKIKILAGGNSPQSQAQARGKLFEYLMAEVLRHYGFSIDRIPNVNYAGMEIDIEGKAIATGIPLYAECKCYETDVDSSKLQEFFGKYMTRWLKDKRCQGLFIALPGVNSHAKGFYKENCEGALEITVCLYEEEQVLNAIFGTKTLASPDVISKHITKDLGTPGDWLLLYTDKGPFWVQYVIPGGAGIATTIALFDAMGNPLSETTTLDYLTVLYPELEDFDKVPIGDLSILRPPSMPQDVEEIVEVRGSSECFEYQFPASPEHFVGRQSILEELDLFVTKIINKETSSRGILFEANSGWGKSSVVLASVARLKKMGYFGVAIDSRTASSSKFILRVLDYVFSKFVNFGGLLSEENRPKTITGFEGAVKALVNIGQVLESNRKVMFIFLDQFENVFFLPEALKRITDLLLKLCDCQTNVVLGFSWKTDLIGLTSEFPYQLRDSITSSSKRIVLETFSEVETTVLLNRLSEELRAPLRKDLRFLLSEFSQGYPWLLKKLCAHVKTQREAGVPQLEIANSLLNIEELFQEDLRLPPDEEEVLRRIAKAAPISVSELGEDLKPEIVKSLVNRRLIIRIGYKFDVYWDIFRDYLNTGKVPVQENYILRLKVGSVLKMINLLGEAGGKLGTSEFQRIAGLSGKSLYNVLRDVRLLGLVKVDNSKVILQVPLTEGEKKIEDLLRIYLRERLRRNRLVWRLLEELTINDSLSLDRMSDILSKSCPYISATKQTWRTYAGNFADWMDFTDLAILEKREKTLARYRPGAEVRERRVLLARRRGGIMMPIIQYKPIEKVVVRLVKALQGGNRIDWSGLKKSTIAKSLATLEDLGFIVKKPGSIRILQKGIEFATVPERSAILLAEGASKMEAFSTFVKILEAHKDKGSTIPQLGKKLKQSLKVDWRDSTATVNAKIMLDWARHTGLAPGVFAVTRRGSKADTKKGTNSQIPLFSGIKE